MRCLLSDLSADVHTKMTDRGIPGLSVSLVLSDGTIQSEGFGALRAGDSSAAVTPATVFEGASLTKPVFAAAVLQLVEAGVLALDEPLNRRLPATYLETDGRIDAITMRHVLCHTPGFPNWRPEGKELMIKQQPGSRFSYSGEGYQFLQTVVEQITGQPADRFVSERIFEPLGMPDSNLSWRADYAAKAAYPHKSGMQCIEHHCYAAANAAYSLYTTSEGYAQFLSALLAPQDDKIISKSLWRDMLTPQIQVSPLLSWGLGWGLDHSVPGESAFWHWGDNSGYKSFVAGVAERQVAVVVLCNSDDGLLACLEICQLALRHPLRGAEQFLAYVYAD